MASTSSPAKYSGYRSFSRSRGTSVTGKPALPALFISLSIKNARLLIVIHLPFPPSFQISALQGCALSSEILLISSFLCPDLRTDPLVRFFPYLWNGLRSLRGNRFFPPSPSQFHPPPDLMNGSPHASHFFFSLILPFD